MCRHQAGTPPSGRCRPVAAVRCGSPDRRGFAGLSARQHRWIRGSSRAVPKASGLTPAGAISRRCEGVLLASPIAKVNGIRTLLVVLEGGGGTKYIAFHAILPPRPPRHAHLVCCARTPAPRPPRGQPNPAG